MDNGTIYLSKADNTRNEHFYFNILKVFGTKEIWVWFNDETDVSTKREWNNKKMTKRQPKETVN